jgi:LPXTG-motif cell wall-anchored protein
MGMTGVGAAGAATGVLLLAASAAAFGWSSTPTGGLAGSAVRVASSAGDPCVWDETAPDGSSVIRYDGVRVQITLLAGGTGHPLGAVPVSAGGTWAGTLRVPAVGAGTYSLTARCVVQDPALPGGRTVDFPAQPFTVSEAPPPTTVTAPPVVPPPPVVATTSTTRGGVANLRTQAAAPAAATLPNTGPAETTLPNTGSGTLAVALAGLGSLGIGGVALWWGGRKRPVPTDPT